VESFVAASFLQLAEQSRVEKEQKATFGEEIARNQVAYMEEAPASSAGTTMLERGESKEEKKKHLPAHLAQPQTGQSSSAQLHLKLEPNSAQLPRDQLS